MRNEDYFGEDFDSLLERAVMQSAEQEIKYYESLPISEGFKLSADFDKIMEKMLSSGSDLACCITGHRDIEESKSEYVRREMQKEVEKAVSDRFTRFLSGFAEGADIVFAEIVAGLKRQGYPIILEAAIPHEGRLTRINVSHDLRELLKSCDDIIVHSRHYTRNCFMRRISKKIRSAYKAQAQKGNFTGPAPPYG